MSLKLDSFPGTGWEYRGLVCRGKKRVNNIVSPGANLPILMLQLAICNCSRLLQHDSRNRSQETATQMAG